MYDLHVVRNIFDVRNPCLKDIVVLFYIFIVFTQREAY